MPETNINQAVTSDIGSVITDYSVDTQTTDGAGGHGETTYHNTNFTQQLGYYKTIPELKAAIDTKTRFMVGNGFTADEPTQMFLDTIKGSGKDTFNKILFNMMAVKQIGGDAFAEIILDDEGNLANLKPLSPETMMIVANEKGMIIRYEQISRASKVNKKFKPEQIFHLMNNRIADEIHGTSDIDAVEEIILMRNEAMSDYKRLMHRNVEPVVIIHADTDDATALAKIKSDWEKVKKSGETWIVPKDVIVPENFAISPNATLNPLSWIQQLNMYFFQAINVPEIVVGGGTNNLTEGSVKIAYFAFENVVKFGQLEAEEQTLSQLNLVIKLTFPASLQGDAFSDKENAEGVDPNTPEIEPERQALEPNDQQAELEGRK